MKRWCLRCGCALVTWPGRVELACVYGHGLGAHRRGPVPRPELPAPEDERARLARASFEIERSSQGQRPADWPWPTRFRFASGLTERSLYQLWIKLNHDRAGLASALDAAVGPSRALRRLAVELLFRNGFLPDAYLLLLVA